MHVRDLSHIIINNIKPVVLPYILIRCIHLIYTYKFRDLVQRRMMFVSICCIGLRLENCFQFTHTLNSVIEIGAFSIDTP